MFGIGKKQGVRDRFEITTNDTWGVFEGRTHIIQDKETGVVYLFVQAPSGGGLTPLLDSDGKPITNL